jgi:hypothetical protein
MGHPRDGEFEKKRRWATRPYRKITTARWFGAREGMWLGSRSGIPPFAKAAKDGAPTGWEFINFLEALQEMPWSWRNRAREGELTVPLTVSAE